MSCYHPLQAFRTPDGVVFNQLSRHDIIGNIELPCGQCIACRMRRASDWSLRILHESKMHASSCFITLTYAPGNLPPDSSLEHRDFQLFIKRVRKHLAPSKVRFFMCGEYGPLNLRPHYHSCIFGHSFNTDRIPSGKSAAGAVFYDSLTLSNLWGQGKVSVQDLTRETASYCARYIMKKVLGPSAQSAYTNPDTGVIRRPEYAAMSLKPGIGSSWFDKYGADVYSGDTVIADGTKHSVPKYYDKLMRRLDAPDIDTIEYKRYQKALLVAADQSPERRAVREIVHNARVSTLKRESF